LPSKARGFDLTAAKDEIQRKIISEQEQLIIALRKQHIRSGKEKLAILYQPDLPRKNQRLENTQNY